VFVFVSVVFVLFFCVIYLLRRMGLRMESNSDYAYWLSRAHLVLCGAVFSIWGQGMASPQTLGQIFLLGFFDSQMQ
jgi:hypothetical protein